MEKLDILFCGLGTIGKEIFPTFVKMAGRSGGEIRVYDPPVQMKEGWSEDLIQSLLDYCYSIAVICVPTEMKDDGSCDCSIVEDLCSKVKADVLIIKSTIPVGETDKISENINSNVIFSPEFTSVNQHKGEHNYVVLGGERKLCNKVAKAYKLIEPADFSIVYTTSKTAEMVKYMTNCFLAMKVTFCNEIAEACFKSGVEYEDVRNIFVMDSRINPSHTWVYEDQPFYDNHCFNKDIPAFNWQFQLPLMESVEFINSCKKTDFNK